MSSDGLSALCLGLAAVATVFVTVALASASLMVQNYTEARVHAETSALDVVVRSQLLLANMPGRVRRMLQTGFFDEDTIGRLAEGWLEWSADGAEDKALAGTKEFEQALYNFRVARSAIAEAIKAQKGALSPEAAVHAQDTLTWEQTWLVLSQATAIASLRLRSFRRLRGTVQRVRRVAGRSPSVAALVCAQLIVAYAAQVSTVGVGEIPLLNAASGLFLTGGTVLLLVSAGFEVSRVVADLAADY